MVMPLSFRVYFDDDDEEEEKGRITLLPCTVNPVLVLQFLVRKVFMSVYVQACVPHGWELGCGTMVMIR